MTHRITISPKLLAMRWPELVAEHEYHDARARRGFRTELGCARAGTRLQILEALIEHLGPRMASDANLTVREALAGHSGPLYSSKQRQFAERLRDAMAGAGTAEEQP